MNRYAGLMVDLDGVVVRETDVIPVARRFLAELGVAGPPIVFVTNNATRTRRQWAELLAAGGVTVDAGQIVSSAVATAGLLTQAGATPSCLVVGEHGLVSALEAAGAVVVTTPEEAEVVVVGSDHDLGFAKLRDATRAILRGARFVGTNPDVVRPGAEGPLPGTGAILAYLEAATGVEAEVVGKPRPDLLRLAADRLSVDGPVLFVGDRIDTDVLAAARLGWDSALALTGVSTWESLIGAPAQPTWVLRDLGQLATDEPVRVRRGRDGDGPTLRRLLSGGAAESPEDALVAEDPGGAVVGAVALRDLGDSGWIQELGLVPGTDAGRRTHLVARAVEELRSRGAREVLVRADDDRGPFESLGFREADRDPPGGPDAPPRDGPGDLLVRSLEAADG